MFKESLEVFDLFMSNEFPYEELYGCSHCGVELPGDLMVWMDDGEILCEECYDEYLRECEQTEIMPEFKQETQS